MQVNDCDVVITINCVIWVVKVIEEDYSVCRVFSDKVFAYDYYERWNENEKVTHISITKCTFKWDWRQNAFQLIEEN
jgi:hypothetical protein